MQREQLSMDDITKGDACFVANTLEMGGASLVTHDVPKLFILHDLLAV